MELRKKKGKENYFSVAFDLIPKDLALPYELYINASNREGVENFVKIYPLNEPLSDNDILEFKHKYRQLYVPEDQRNMYLRSLVKVTDFPDEKKTDVIKDSAIKHLSRVFDSGEELNTEVLAESIEGCRETVSAMIDVIQDYTIHQLREMIGSLSFHDFYTYDHSVNVSLYCISIYRHYNPKATKEELTLIGMGGLLHDIGKIEVPTSIINSTGKLTDEEFAVIKKHPGAGIRILMEKMVDYPHQDDLSTIMRIVGEHHENEDGTGYPRGLKGEDIHVYAKVCAVADFFDAITTKRSYSEVVTADEAISIMERSVGKKLNKEIFAVLAEDVTRIYGKKAATRELPHDFEPSIPHNVLPFKKIEAKKLDVDLLGKKDEKGSGFGKIKTR